jgi:hypothetical protein
MDTVSGNPPNEHRTLSGVLVWLILFIVIGPCSLPIPALASILSYTTDNVAVTVAPLLCPPDASGDTHVYFFLNDTYEFRGVYAAKTGHYLACNELDRGKSNVQLLVELVWSSVFFGGSVIFTGLLALVITNPAGSFVSRLFYKLFPKKGRPHL